MFFEGELQYKYLVKKWHIKLDEAIKLLRHRSRKKAEG